jgi:hypothetical protein
MVGIIIIAISSNSIAISSNSSVNWGKVNDFFTIFALAAGAAAAAAAT